MSVSDRVNKASEISGTKPWENLSLQDALIIISMYAAQLDPAAKDNKKVKRIADLAQKHPLFSDESADVVARIHRLADPAGSGDFLQVVDHAVKSLTLKLRRTAFEWTAELAVVDGVLPKEKQELVEQLRTKLYIDKHAAHRIISEAIENSTP